MQNKFFMNQCLAKILLDSQAFMGVNVHVFIEHAVGVASRQLGSLRCQFRFTQQC